MYAYIKFEKTCPRHGEKTIVSVHDIKHFQATTMKCNKLYNIRCGSGYCSGLVLMVDDTIELLQKKINAKRIMIPAKKAIESASEITDSESQKVAAKSKKESQNAAGLKELMAKKVSEMKKKYGKPVTNKIISSENENVLSRTVESTARDTLNKEKTGVVTTPPNVLENILNKRYYSNEKSRVQKNAKEEISSTPVTKGTVMNSVSLKKSKYEQDNDDIINLPKTRTSEPSTSSKSILSTASIQKIRPADAETAVEPVKPAQTSKDVEVPIESCTSGKKADKSVVPKKLLKTFLNHVVDAEASSNRREKDTERNQCSQKVTQRENKDRNNDKYDGDSQTCCQCLVFASNEKLLNKKLREATKQIEEYKQQMESLTASRDDEREMSKQTQLLNIELQKTVIDYFNEIKSNSSEVMKQAMTHVLQDGSSIPVGHERKRNQTIHLGHGVWLKTSTYKAILLNARTPAIFVKNMAVAVFGTSVLAKSSVTGTVCNRLKKGQSKATAKPKLNSVKVMAIADIFRYWLTKKGFSEVEIDLHVGKIGNIISHKICDLNRPVQKKKKASLKQISNAPTLQFSLSQRNFRRMMICQMTLRSTVITQSETLQTYLMRTICEWKMGAAKPLNCPL